MANNKAFKVKNGLELAEYAKDIAVTAVDVFVYDTSKDSDGGAWRKRTQATSWYQETLNTATRGSRKEFPAVAVIVATTTTVTIYDGDDPALPMWRVTNQIDGVVPQFWREGRSATSLYALNGKLVIGIVTDTPAGLAMIDFAADLLFRWSSGGTSGGTLSGVSNDASATATLSGVLPALVSTAVNDVAMTVLPNAPIDAATGLPVPTIAVATDGGVSVITDSGAVYDSTETAKIYHIDFGTTGLWIGSDGLLLYAAFGDITADGFETLVGKNDNSKPIHLYARIRNSGLVGYTGSDIAFGGNITGFRTIQITSPDYNDFNNSMSAVLTPTYNTGWMNGDIKGAFLSDTDATSVVGSGELVTNGTFATNITGWTASATASLSLDANRIKVTNTTSSISFAYQLITTVVGETYTATFEITDGTSTNAQVQLGTNGGSGQYGSSAVNGFGQITFVATTTTTYITLLNGNAIDTGYCFFGNISVRLAEKDRSVNNKGLQVFGTITKTAVATGADLVAYSGFSASNYLEQPYNSDLDFGTGDFCYMGWVKATASAGNQVLFERKALATAPFIDAYLSSSLTPIVRTANGTSTAVTSSASLSSGVWSFFSVVRKSGVLSMYINGVVSGSNTSLEDMTIADSALYFGVRQAGTATLSAGSLALWRISATAPSAAQIAKIYNDEKYLFQAGAQATLYGASDSVIALGYDDATELLHVGTSQGRSVFQGLRRVDNTTTAVGTAISASNNLVAEE